MTGWGMCRTTEAMSRGLRGDLVGMLPIQPRAPGRAAIPGTAQDVVSPVDIFERLDRCANLLTVKELATLLAINPKTIYGYAARNLIPHYRIAASVRFRARDIAEWLRSHAA